MTEEELKERGWSKREGKCINTWVHPDKILDTGQSKFLRTFDFKTAVLIEEKLDENRSNTKTY